MLLLDDDDELALVASAHEAALAACQYAPAPPPSRRAHATRKRCTLTHAQAGPAWGAADSQLDCRSSCSGSRFQLTPELFWRRPLERE